MLPIPLLWALGAAPAPARQAQDSLNLIYTINAVDIKPARCGAGR